MSIKSEIEWTDDTWNPWRGCHKVSPGCKYCYMYRNMDRTAMDPFTPTRSTSVFYDPIKKLKGPLVFTCSWSDFFIQEADEWRPEAWDIIRASQHLSFQILTKRPERILEHLPEDWGDGWKNVWLGVSVESNKYRYRMDILRDIPAYVRFVSAEPLLEAVNLNLNGFHWVITGGESEASKEKCRPAEPDWFRIIRDKCAQEGVAYFHKQNGGYRKDKIDHAYGGRMLDGQYWDEYPQQLYDRHGSIILKAS